MQTKIQNSKNFKLDLTDLKNIAIYGSSIFAVWYLSNISWIQSFLTNNFGFSSENVLLITSILTYLSKRFVQNNTQTSSE